MKSTIGARYEISSRVGSGGAGVLYLARDRSLDKTVAVKLLHPNLADRDMIVRLQQEARLLCQLQHPNLVSVSDFGLDGNSPYIVMEYIEGMSLSEFVKKFGPADLPVALKILIDIASGLRYVHEHGVLHRDLKPSNVMLILDKETQPVQAKIVDFGIAKPAESGSSQQSLTKSGAILGSPSYMPPEMAQGKEADARSDIYSFGCLMYFLLTAVPPFRGDTITSTLLMQINDDAPSLSQVRNDLSMPAEIQAIVSRTLEKKPEKRFQNGAELLEALQSAKAELDRRASADRSTRATASGANDRDPLFFNHGQFASHPLLVDKRVLTLSIALVISVIVCCAGIALRNIGTERRAVKEVS
ncbi:MAG TPA: serine/threonine-protein kinase, partial [Nitrososphaera sp.]|nr:serine/threonine-protein kinase [Nitrososphaera sp.]